MKHLPKLCGLFLITVATLALCLADKATLAALGVAVLFGLGFTGFALAVWAGLITDEDRREADGLDHPDNIGDRN